MQGFLDPKDAYAYRESNGWLQPDKITVVPSTSFAYATTSAKPLLLFLLKE